MLMKLLSNYKQLLGSIKSKVSVLLLKWLSTKRDLSRCGSVLATYQVFQHAEQILDPRKIHVSSENWLIRCMAKKSEASLLSTKVIKKCTKFSEFGKLFINFLCFKAKLLIRKLNAFLIASKLHPALTIIFCSLHSFFFLICYEWNVKVHWRWCAHTHTTRLQHQLRDAWMASID